MNCEGVYRFALRAYPRQWRAQRQAEVLGVLMDAAADRGAQRAGALGVGNLVVHGAAARVRTLTEPVGDGVRSVMASMALSSLTLLSLLLAAFGEVWPWNRAGVQAGGTQSTSFDGTFGPFFTLGGPLLVLVLVQCVCAYLGLLRIVKAALTACVVMLVLASVAAPFLGMNRPAVWAVVGVVVLAGLTRTGKVKTSSWWAVGTLAVTAAGAGAIWAGRWPGQAAGRSWSRLALLGSC